MSVTAAEHALVRRLVTNVLYNVLPYEGCTEGKTEMLWALLDPTRPARNYEQFAELVVNVTRKVQLNPDGGDRFLRRVGLPVEPVEPVAPKAVSAGTDDDGVWRCGNRNCTECYPAAAGSAG